MKYLKVLSLALAALFLTNVTIAEEAAEKAVKGGERAMAIQFEAEIVDIDLETREISLADAHGDVVTMVAGEEVYKLEEFQVGETIVATYLSSLAAEIREPTAAELAEPWVEVEGAVKAAEGEAPGVAGLRQIRAVCTIEGMNRVSQTVMIQDPRGKLHVIGDVDPANLEGLTLGQQVVMTFSQALALSLEKTGE